MTETRMKNLLNVFQEQKAQAELIGEYAEIYGNRDALQRYEKEKFKIKIISDLILLLNDEERFVVETHLIMHHTWTETVCLYSEKYGKFNEKSERTLKRDQSRAIKKMAGFINNLSIEDVL